MHKQETIFRVASRVRGFIDNFEKHSLPEYMRNFPAGACGDTSIVLAAILQDYGVSPVDYIYGVRYLPEGGHDYDHAWMLHEDILIDITADQFGEPLAPVIGTSDSQWHKQFNIDNRGDLGGWGNNLGLLSGLYSRLKDQLISELVEPSDS